MAIAHKLDATRPTWILTEEAGASFQSIRKEVGVIDRVIERIRALKLGKCRCPHGGDAARSHSCT
jgi:hypothetical protein